MNKKLLSLAVAAGVTGLASGAAQAVDFTAATPTPAYVATELTIPTAGIAINHAAVAARFDAGFSIDDTNERYVRIDISGGTWGAQQLVGALSVNDSSGANGN
jgi:hypothetical protein